ncbi:hypothetical protein VOLCADRAFT_91070 [Volvox carteri f. nagariensis]|uniref:Uncharacterized protein n=1 Tax=Volvox carteri f. nagariensis TaxID=3068 RepID=D8TW36_VOLCA|nr:uncharacterized protein VOLCADRAFT_91070 [Volvox carteri f. nagariensis]EFJ48410.1 hypothetical protein VOLCADRAFT_91070 [Volvox carteri f. nagariensis]|eukprot:XP_002950664.1 hypothetical protein VOLCADRAFT_91070 [Volvox carteri f. nagariensis]
MSYGLHGRILDSLKASYADVKFRVKLGRHDRAECLLGLLEAYCKATGMAANAAKCEVLIFGGATRERKRLIEAAYRLGGAGLRVLTGNETARYLGLHYGPGVQFSACTKQLLTAVPHPPASNRICRIDGGPTPFLVSSQDHLMIVCAIRDLHSGRSRISDQWHHRKQAAPKSQDAAGYTVFAITMLNEDGNARDLSMFYWHTDGAFACLPQMLEWAADNNQQAVGDILFYRYINVNIQMGM